LPLIGCAFLIFGVALAIRMAVIFWHKNKTKRQLFALRERINNPKFKAAIRQREKGMSKTYQPFEERIKIFESLLLHWKEAVIIGWSGMRGIVSLAAALSLPLIMADGSDFPQRDTILFLTVAVVIIMLVIQGLGLPILVKLLKIKEKK
jgi:CPA1 family monovalent cation:H+ antiporter